MTISRASTWAAHELRGYFERPRFDFGRRAPIPPCLSTDRDRFRKDAEAGFPIKVEIRVPAYGEPWPFAEMLNRNFCLNGPMVVETRAPRAVNDNIPVGG